MGFLNSYCPKECNEKRRFNTLRCPDCRRFWFAIILIGIVVPLAIVAVFITVVILTVKIL